MFLFVILLSRFGYFLRKKEGCSFQLESKNVNTMAFIPHLIGGLNQVNAFLAKARCYCRRSDIYLLSFERFLKNMTELSIYTLIMKNASSALSTVKTRTDLSRYLLPNSHDVSSKKRQECSAHKRRPRCNCVSVSGRDRCDLGLSHETGPLQKWSISSWNVREVFIR
jgi:hypothetical protein